MLTEVAPVSRHLLWGGLQQLLIWAHDIPVPLLVAVLLAQWVAVKGTPQHVSRGRILSIALGPVIVLTGAMVLGYRMMHGEPAAEPPHGYVVPNFIGPTYIMTYGLCYTGCLANLVLPVRFFRNLWGLIALHSITLVMMSLAYQVMLGEIATRGTEHYNGQVSVELTLMGSVFPLIELGNLLVLLQVRRGASFSWLDHHKLNAIWLTSLTMAPLLLFLAHDQYWLFGEPHGLWCRVGVELAPQVLFLGFHVGFLARYFRRWLRPATAPGT